jgi:hypothetical protein
MQLDQALCGIYIPVEQPFGEGVHGWVGKQMARWGQHVQWGLVSTSIANSRL